MLEKIPFRAVGWGVAALVTVVLGLLVFNKLDPGPKPSPQNQQASLRIFRAKIPMLSDSGTPEFIDRVVPEAEKTVPPAAAEISAPPPAPEPPQELAKLEAPQIRQPEIKPPPLKPVAQKKAAEKNTIYRESFLLDQNSSFYTLQVLGVRNEESLLKFIKVHKLLQNQNVAYYKISYKGKQWYPLLYGVYPTKSEAKSAVQELPDAVQKSIPWIRKMSAVQNEVQTEAKR